MPNVRQHPSRTLWSWSFWWWQELLSVTASLAFVTAVAVIVGRMERKPVSEWTFRISLNATVAACITAAKSCAMLAVATCIGQWKWNHYRSKIQNLQDFDTIEGAARGPYGAVVLLATLPWRGLATLGALVTILALGTDTFAQQVLSTDTITTWVDDGSASFSLATAYWSGASELSSDSWQPDPYTLDIGMPGAVYRGIYGLEVPSIFECASNCTWGQSHISLGFSTECQNVTEATVSSRNCTSNYGTSLGNCTMTTPGGVTLDIILEPTSYGTVFVVNANSVYDDSKGQLPELRTGIKLSAAFLRVATFSQESEYRGIEASSGVSSNSMLNPQALECTLSLAAYNYSSASSNGSVFAFDSVEVLPLGDGTVSGLDYDGLEPHISFNQTPNGLPGFNVSMLDLGPLITFFKSDSFSGMLLDGEGDMPAYARGITTAMPSLERNVSAVMEAMAESMTNQLRAQSGSASNVPTTAAARGLTATSVVLVRVQWMWLALPFTVAASSLLLLIAVMICSRESQGVELWKSSSTALLYHSVSGSPERGILDSRVATPRELQESAQRTSARLTNTRESDAKYFLRDDWNLGGADLEGRL